MAVRGFRSTDHGYMCDVVHMNVPVGCIYLYIAQGGVHMPDKLCVFFADES